MLIKIDDIMTKNVQKLDINSTLSEAEEMMQSTNIDKLVVTKNDLPMGVLEIWKILPSDRKMRISEVKLSPLSRVDKGTDLEQVKQTLLNTAAVVVVEKANPTQIVGVATAMDLLKVE